MTAKTKQARQTGGKMNYKKLRMTRLPVGDQESAQGCFLRETSSPIWNRGIVIDRVRHRHANVGHSRVSKK